MIVNLTFLAPLTLQVDLREDLADPIVGCTVETPNVASMRELFDDGHIKIDDHEWNRIDEALAPELHERLIAADRQHRLADAGAGVVRADEASKGERVRHPQLGDVVTVDRVDTGLSFTRVHFRAYGERGYFTVLPHTELEEC